VTAVVARGGASGGPTLRWARVAVGTVFFVSGAGFAGWAARIPAVRADLGLSDVALGVALLGPAMGALVAMPLSGALVARHGSRPVTRVFVAAYCAALALPTRRCSHGPVVSAPVPQARADVADASLRFALATVAALATISRVGAGRGGQTAWGARASSSSRRMTTRSASVSSAPSKIDSTRASTK
jgi:MFS family permease